jgi:hypothetical protein
MRLAPRIVYQGENLDTQASDRAHEHWVVARPMTDGTHHGNDREDSPMIDEEHFDAVN